MRSPTLFYVRHGETVWNRLQRLQGRQDSPLTLVGVELAIDYGSRLKRTLGGERDVEIVASPMGRARQTAAIVADVLGLDANAITIDERVAEHDVGEWAGRSWAEIQAAEGIDSAALRDWDSRPPGGETRREMLTRGESWLEGWRAAPRSSAATILVSHGGFSRVLRGAFLRLDLAAMTEIPVHTHGTLYRLTEGRCDEVLADVDAPRVAHEGQTPPEDLLG